MGNVPTGPVEKVPGDELEVEPPPRPSGPRFPRPHLQRLETEPGVGIPPKRLASGSIAPAFAHGTIDFADEDKTPIGTLELD